MIATLFAQGTEPGLQLPPDFFPWFYLNNRMPQPSLLRIPHSCVTKPCGVCVLSGIIHASIFFSASFLKNS